MPEFIQGKQSTNGVTVIKHISISEGTRNDILAGGFTNELTGSLSMKMEPWIAFFNIDRATGDPVMYWGNVVTGLSASA